MKITCQVEGQFTSFSTWLAACEVSLVLECKDKALCMLRSEKGQKNYFRFKSALILIMTSLLLGPVSTFSGRQNLK